MKDARKIRDLDPTTVAVDVVPRPRNPHELDEQDGDVIETMPVEGDGVVVVVEDPEISEGLHVIERRGSGYPVLGSR